MFYFHPYLGKWSNLTNIFQMGWNHPLVMIMIEIYSLLDAVWQKGAQVPKNWCFSIVFVQHTCNMGGSTFFCQKPIHHINMYSVYVDITSTYLSTHTHTYIYIWYDISRWFLDESCSFKYSSTKNPQRRIYFDDMFKKRSVLILGINSSHLFSWGILIMGPYKPLRNWVDDPPTTWGR